MYPRKQLLFRMIFPVADYAFTQEEAFYLPHRDRFLGAVKFVSVVVDDAFQMTYGVVFIVCPETRRIPDALFPRGGIIVVIYGIGFIRRKSGGWLIISVNANLICFIIPFV